MWAAGCVLYELCCLRVPFTATNLPSLAAQIQLGVYQPLPRYSIIILNLLKKLVEVSLTIIFQEKCVFFLNVIKEMVFFIWLEQKNSTFLTGMQQFSQNDMLPCSWQNTLYKQIR